MRKSIGTAARLRRLGLVIVLAGCTSAPAGSIEPARLTETDIEVIRVTIASVIPLIRRLAESPIHLKTATLTFGPPQEARAGLPSPLPSPAFGWDLIRTQLTPDERVAWQARNGSSFEIPELGISGLVNRREGDLDETGPTVSVSAPIYPTRDSAVIYATFACGGSCGEGLLIRLNRAGLSWRVTVSEGLWII